MTSNFEHRIDDFKEHLVKCGVEAIQVFTTQNYGPFDYLNELCPTNALEHDRFVSKFKDGILMLIICPFKY